MPFLLTRPLRGATYQRQLVDLLGGISTHTPLAGRDPLRGVLASPIFHFYSHAPCGARRCCFWNICANFFISTHTPLAGRDIVKKPLKQQKMISTHTPLAGRDNNTPI